MILQLNPPLPVYVINKGNGLAHGWIDYGIEDHLYWIVAMDDTGEVWVKSNPNIRLRWNISYGRINMPFKSKSQMRKFFAMEKRGELPKGKAEQWAKETKSIKKLPNKVKKVKKK